MYQSSYGKYGPHDHYSLNGNKMWYQQMMKQLFIFKPN